MTAALCPAPVYTNNEKLNALKNVNPVALANMPYAIPTGIYPKIIGVAALAPSLKSFFIIISQEKTFSAKKSHA